MSDTTLRLAIIIGSTRRGRYGPAVATWFEKQAREHGGFEIDVIDLADVDLPPVLVGDGDPVPPSVLELGSRLAAADAFVPITPEYNHSYPASLKLAIDWFGEEWRAKAVGFVSYGGMSGGLRSVEHLRGVFAEMHAATIRETVSLHHHFSLFDADGQLADPEGPNTAARRLLDQLSWWARALKDHRAAHPYVTG
jgi:NAD(P)H-dependent FMN reductase